MYYRVAIQMDRVPAWQWKSTILSELSAVFQWLWLYRALPQDRLRVFSSSSREEMDEQLVRENQGLLSISATAGQFLHERRIGSPEVIWGVSASGTRRNERTVSIAVVTGPPNESSRESQSLDERGVRFLEKRRVELEHGAGGDHDQPYTWSLPPSGSHMLAWAKLRARRVRGEFEP